MKLRGILVVLCMCLVAALAILLITSGSAAPKYTDIEIMKKPTFTVNVFEDWYDHKGLVYRFMGEITDIEHDEVTLQMFLIRANGIDGGKNEYPIRVIIDTDKPMKYPISNWENPKIGDYVEIVGELSKVENGNSVHNKIAYIRYWYYDSGAVSDYYTALEGKIAREEEEKKSAELERLEEYQRVELDSIMDKLKAIPMGDVSQISNLRMVKEKLYQFKISYPAFSGMDEVDAKIAEIDNTILELETIKAYIITTAEGHIELDTILTELESLVVDPVNMERFKILCESMNYDNIVLLEPGQASYVAEEIYGVMSKPEDTTELDNLIERYNEFAKKCPDFSKDDVLNHKYEFIALLLRGLN